MESTRQPQLKKKLVHTQLRKDRTNRLTTDKLSRFRKHRIYRMWVCNVLVYCVMYIVGTRCAISIVIDFQLIFGGSIQESYSISHCFCIVQSIRRLHLHFSTSIYCKLSTSYSFVYLEILVLKLKHLLMRDKRAAQKIKEL